MVSKLDIVDKVFDMWAELKKKNRRKSFYRNSNIVKRKAEVKKSYVKAFEISG